MTIGIYCIRHRESGKRYVGKSVNIESRFCAHRGLLSRDECTKSTNRYLFAAVKKYGLDAFEFEIVETLDSNDHAVLSARELHWMDAFESTSSETGYNLRRDSSSGMEVHAETRKLQALNAVRIHTGKTRSDRTKENISKALKGKLIGRKQTPEHVEARVSKRRGVKRGWDISESHRLSISIAASKPKSEETRLKISIAKTGTKMSLEARKHMSEAFKGRIVSQETRDKQSAIRKGRKVSDETRLKQSIAAKTRWEKQRGSK